MKKQLFISFLHRYAYVRNNPYKYVDPNGLWAVLINAGAGFAVFPGAVGGSISGGVAISYSKQYGFQTTLASTTGGGLAIGESGTFSIGIDYSPKAQQISDISGSSESELPRAKATWRQLLE